MAEVPSVAYRIPEYAAMGIDGVSIGSNDLTQLMLGVDRDSEVCAELFDEADEAVLDAIRRIIQSARWASATGRRSPRIWWISDHLHLGEPRCGDRRTPRHGPRRAAPAHGGRPPRSMTRMYQGRAAAYHQR